jgi:hypothetical protein
MNVFITLDYEIFFGENQGTIDKTLIYPTELLLKTTLNTSVKFTFFVDIGFLIKLDENKIAFPKLDLEHQLVIKQIKKLVALGHDCQLHIHPHWEKAIFDGKKWLFDYNYYKLADFSDDEIKQIFEKYTQALQELTQKPIHSFRAGGWCLQPFNRLKKAFTENHINIDSSVFIGGKHMDAPYAYDYTNTPSKAFWRFSSNECESDEQGAFIELPISSNIYSPLFFWRLFLLGNLFPSKHKPIGNGKPMPSSLTRKKLLTQKHLMSASIDGYFSSKMNKIIQNNYGKGKDHTVFIGHPKALTLFSIQELTNFIQKNHQQYHFKTFSDFKNEISR